MNLANHYQNLWEDSLQKFKNGDFEFDPFLKAQYDKRYGLTLRARISQAVQQRVLKAFEKVRTIAPNQYYYPGSDLHITILTIITCQAGFSLEQINTSFYCDIIRPAIESISPFRITFNGITASPSSVLVQGFPEDNQLATLRNNLRNQFNNAGLRHSIDQRYKLQTAHMTTMRFKEPFSDAEEFVNHISTLRDISFGHTAINRLELVGNDWYQQKDKVQYIKSFDLTF